MATPPKHRPQVTICIPHWQAKLYMQICLRSIRKHSQKYDVEVIVVDNGSRDDSIDYLRSLNWIRLIERPEEVTTNWPQNVFTAWDEGLKHARGEYYMTMHTDVFIKFDNWLDPFLLEMNRSPKIAAAGAWKLVIENPFYRAQKDLFGFILNRAKLLLGLKQRVVWNQQRYPRDYCAMYRRNVLIEHDLSFVCIDHKGGGFSIATQLWNAGYEMGVFSITDMSDILVHIAHGTAAIAPEKPLNHRRAQRQVEGTFGRLFEEQWIKDLQHDESLDGDLAAAA
jgi:glycosyltransferase involved in cell wall biosynthesis